MTTPIQQQIDDLKMRIAIDAGLLAHLYGAPATSKVLANIAAALRHGPKSGLTTGAGEPIVPVAAVFRGITEEIAEMTGFSVEELRGLKRHKFLSEARFEVWARIYETGGYSLPQIGNYFSGRDHTTILNGIRRAKQNRERAA